MRVVEVREDNPWPEWTEPTQVVEGMHKPVFVRPVLARRVTDGEIAWPSVQIRIGGLGPRKGAKFNGHTLAEAEEKADRLRADAQSSGHSGTVPFKVQLRKTAVNTKLTPAEARRVAQAIDEARRLLLDQLGGETPRPDRRPTLLEALARVGCFKGKKENSAVEVLGHILSTSEATRAALSDLVVAGGAPIGRIDRVKTQVIGPMGARPDLAGYDESGREHVLIEAKFKAKLAPKTQPDTYLKRLRGKRQPSVVLFVAPAERCERLWKELHSVSKIKLQPGHHQGGRSAAVANSACWLMLTSWKALLDRMQAGVSADSVVGAHLRELRWLVDWQPPPSR